jgi:hypothetical protein
MTALAADRVQTARVMKRVQLTLASGQSVYQGALLGITLGTGTVVEATATTGIFICGTASEAVDASGGAKSIQVELDKEISLRWLANHTSNTVAAANVGQLCYVEDDQTVSTNSASRVIAGRVWAVDATKGVLVELLSVGSELSAFTAPIAGGELVAPVAGDVIVTAAAIQNRGVYTLPDLAANSTVTLPVTGVADGTQITIIADGGQGAYTTQYRFGTTNISAALAASKAHQCVATKYGTGWSCTTTVSP